MKKRGRFSILVAVSFLLLLLPACKIKVKYTGYKGESGGMQFNGTVGNIYQFIFGSNSLGMYGLDSTGFNVSLFVGFLFLLAATVIGLVVLFHEESSNLMLVGTVATGGATFFLSPIFTAIAVNGFYDSLPEIKKTGSYAEYKDFRFGYGCVLLFVFLIIVFIYDLVSTIHLKKEGA